MSNQEHRKQRQAAWWNYFKQFRDVFKYASGQARHYARMAVDKDLAKTRD